MISVRLCTQDVGSVTQSCKCIADWHRHGGACVFVSSVMFARTFLYRYVSQLLMETDIVRMWAESHREIVYSTQTMLSGSR